MLDLLEVTTLLKNNGVNAVSKKLKVKKAAIYNLLKNNSLEYIDGEVRPIESKNNNITKVIPKNKGLEEVAVTKVLQKDKISNNEPPQAIIQSLNKDIDMNSLKELLSLIEPIKEVIQEYNKNKNIINIEKVELNPKNITEIKQKLFKIDIDVLKDWEKFVAEHRQFKVQNLISLALEEFINKYK